MIKKVLLLFFLTCILPCRNSLAQCVEFYRLTGKIRELTEDSPSWSCLEFKDSIVLEYKGRFTTNTIYSPRNIGKREKNKPDSNTLVLTFKSSPNWTDSLYAEIKKNNINYISILKEEYITYYDRTGWPAKISIELVNLNPIKYISRFEFKTDAIYDKIKSLPDFRIETCGVWIKSSIDFSSYYIVQSKIRTEINEMILGIISLDPYILNSIDLQENF